MGCRGAGFTISCKKFMGNRIKAVLEVRNMDILEYNSEKDKSKRRKIGRYINSHNEYLRRNGLEVVGKNIIKVD